MPAAIVGRDDFDGSARRLLARQSRDAGQTRRPVGAWTHPAAHAMILAQREMLAEAQALRIMLQSEAKVWTFEIERLKLIPSAIPF